MSAETSRVPKSNWIYLVLILLVAEKIIQHVFVTLAFTFNWGNIASTVAVPPTILMVLGAIVAVLFGLALWGMLQRRSRAVDLIMALAMFDILGEFVAQGKFAIVLTVSFIVAILLLVLALVYRRQLRRA